MFINHLNNIIDLTTQNPGCSSKLKMYDVMVGISNSNTSHNFCYLKPNKCRTKSIMVDENIPFKLYAKRTSFLSIYCNVKCTIPIFYVNLIFFTFPFV